MKSALNQFVLLGLICQGLSWDDYFLPLINAALWVVCLKLPRKPVEVGSSAEAALILAGVLLGYAAGEAFNVSTHFAVGHGITAIQLVRLMRPLNRREKMFAVIGACVQVGVACTAILDFRFVLIFLAAVWLIPRTLMELERGEFPQRDAAAASCPRIPLKIYGSILIAAVVLFLVFPRNFLGSPLSTSRSASDTDSSLEDAILDPSLGGQALSDRILMQIQGENVGYLRAFAMVDFENGQWSVDRKTVTRYVNFKDADLDRFLYRRVRVKEIGYLGKVLPTDGVTVNLRGKFFRRLSSNVHGVISATWMWNTANNIYEYWIDPDDHYTWMPQRLRGRYLRTPRASERLRQWMAGLLEGARTPLEKARALETHFRENFEYRIGAPQLDRVNQLDDFIFNQREGHCERFASTLALLLRMQGIPSRVMVGYVPGSKNLFTGGYNVRFKDAHAWTEGYIDDIGWVTLDATPRGTFEPSSLGLRELRDSLEFAWYLHVVNFGGPTQQLLLQGAREWIQGAAEWMKTAAADDEASSPLPYVVGAIPALAICLVFYKILKSRRDESLGRSKRKALIHASHFYGRMTQALARRGWGREPQETPMEFLNRLIRHNVSWIGDAELITRRFCEVRYGNRKLDPEEKKRLENALKHLKRAIKAG